MKREPKTPRTKRHCVYQWLYSQELFCQRYGRYRRLPKGKRAKSGQWWRRRPPHPIYLENIVVDGRQVTAENLHEFYDEVDTDTGRGSIWIAKEEPWEPNKRTNE